MDRTASPPYALAVDDDGLIRMDVLDILEEAGFRTFEATNGDHALTILQQHHAAIVLLFTDVQMPGLHDGFALARETSRCWPHISIVVASGHVHPNPGDLPDEVRFINKPFSASLVREHLRDILPDGWQPGALKQ